MSGYFTPLNSDHTERLKFKWKDIKVLEGWENEPVAGPVAVLLIAGKRYVMHRMNCDPWNNCLCDARIEELPQGARPPELVKDLYIDDED